MEDTLTYNEQVTDQQDPQPKPKKLSIKDFASKIKAKYPDYKDVPDDELTNKIIAKYPEYKEQVELSQKKIQFKLRSLCQVAQKMYRVAYQVVQYLRLNLKIKNPSR